MEIDIFDKLYFFTLCLVQLFISFVVISDYDKSSKEKIGCISASVLVSVIFWYWIFA